jgi:uncharacterized protein (TIGR03435 family)
LPPRGRGEDPKFQEAYLRSCAITYFNEHLRGTATLDEFARVASYFAQQPILNRTGFDGLFTFNVYVGSAYLTPQLPGVQAPRVESNGPSFVAAVRDQMGLTARQERQPVRVFVLTALGSFVEN